MDQLVRTALKGQYHAALAMLANCVEKCPEDVWRSGPHPRTFWQLAMHGTFFAHLYLGQNLEAYVPWPGRGAAHDAMLKMEAEPCELPETAGMIPREEALEYIKHVDSLIDPTIDAMDLMTEDCGIPWYGQFGKLSHQLLNIRHIAVHTGQLQELLAARGIETDWVSKGWKEKE